MKTKMQGRLTAGKIAAAGLAAALMLAGCSRSQAETAPGHQPEAEAGNQPENVSENQTDPAPDRRAAAGNEAGASGGNRKNGTSKLPAGDGFIAVSGEFGEVEIPLNPERVAVFDMAILDSMDSLEIEAEYAVPTANLTASLSKYETAVNAGGIKEPDLEAVYEFEPDLIIISGRQNTFYEELSKIAPTWYVNIDYANLIEDFQDTYTTLGKVFGREEEVMAAMKETLDLAGETAKKGAAMTEKALILLTNDGSISAYGPGSRFGLIHDVLKVPAADGNVEASTHGASVGFEYIAEINPDILYVVDRTAIVAGTNFASDTLDNDLVKSTNAAKNGKIVYLDPETWYLAGLGLRTFPEMIREAASVIE